MTHNRATAYAFWVTLLIAGFSFPLHALACVVQLDAAPTCTESALDACLPGGGLFDGSVIFICGGAATITVTSTKTISADTTIDGGSLITISGGNSVGVFSVNTGVKFTVQSLTIANGESTNGGGIDNEGGTLTVAYSIFSGNSADLYGGGIDNEGGTLTVTNSTFSGNSAGVVTTGGGGGIAHDASVGSNFVGTASVTNSTFSGNSAGPRPLNTCAGGGIWSGGTLTVTNSTFSGNSAAGSGGGIYSFAPLAVINSTISGNYASVSSTGQSGGGIFNDAFNGGTSGPLTVTNTVIANNTAGNCGVRSPADGGASVPVIDGGHNIDDGASCGFTGTGCTATGTSLCNTNPVLDPTGLQNNGGPTQTIALQPGSPAINGGDDAVCAAAPVNNLDQRGFIRPATGSTHCSIGAHEFNAAPVPPGTSGCADGQREGFVDAVAYPDIAGCSGGWSIPGIHNDNPGTAPACGIPTSDTVTPACGRTAGDDSSNPNGTGCDVADLCASGWYVCASAEDVATHSPTGCSGATQAGDPPFFFASRQSTTGRLECAPHSPDVSNDVFGCGSLGVLKSVFPPACAPLDSFVALTGTIGDLCHIGAPWHCGSSGVCEAFAITKSAPDRGGVLCCRDQTAPTPTNTPTITPTPTTTPTSPPAPPPPPDTDRDGIIDTLDDCPFVANPDQQDTDSDGVGDACDNCPNDFNPFQTDVCGAGKNSAASTYTALSLKRVRLIAAPDGTVRVTGTLDTTQYGGLDGFVKALRRRQPTDTSTASTLIRQGNVLAVNVTGAGLTFPGQTMVFPPCASVAHCAGTNGEDISFLRKGATNLFSVRLRGQGKPFAPPLSSAGVTVTLSLGGFDDVDQANCRAFGRGKSASCRK